MKVGIIGAGGIAHKMAQTLSRMTEAEFYAIASRSADKAESFAKQYGAARAYGSYEALLEDGAVDLVYIALPHSHHCEWTLAALDAGKHVLCEKAFAANAAQTRQMLARAAEKKRLLAEAIWTRYMPSRALIDEVVASGRLGKVVALSANLGYRIDGHITQQRAGPRVILRVIALGDIDAFGKRGGRIAMLVLALHAT